jgi:glycosyltransferase involved in cell wall biosynthesis
VNRSRILGDSWYAREIGAEELEGVARGRLWERLLASGPGRGIALWWWGRRYPVIVCTLAGSGTRTLLALERVLGRRGRHLVLLEFIPVLGRKQRASWGRSSPQRRLAGELYWKYVAVPVLRRCLLGAHSLTRWERDRNAQSLQIDVERFHFIPFFGSGTASDEKLGRGRGVLASGRAACDWETVFSAAAGQHWALTAICSREELPRVQALNKTVGATLLCDVSREEHQAHVEAAAIYLLALREAEVSSGHVRLADAERAGTAVAASLVRGLEDYVEPERDVIAFTPEAPLAARAAVARLLADDSLRQQVASGARDRGRRWTRDLYLQEIARLVEDLLTRVEA